MATVSPEAQPESTDPRRLSVVPNARNYFVNFASRFQVRVWHCDEWPSFHWAWDLHDMSILPRAHGDDRWVSTGNARTRRGAVRAARKRARRILDGGR